MILFISTLLLKFLVPKIFIFVSAIQLSFPDSNLGLNGFAQFLIIKANFALDLSVIKKLTLNSDLIITTQNIIPHKVAILLEKQIFVNNQLETIRNSPYILANLPLLPFYLVDSFLLNCLSNIEVYEIEFNYIPRNFTLPLSATESYAFISNYVNCDVGNTFETIVRVPMDISLDMTLSEVRDQARRILDHDSAFLEPELLQIVKKFANLNSVLINKVNNAKQTGLLNSYVNFKHF